MRYLIWYFKSCFCKHKWIYEERNWAGSNLLGQQSSGITISATCSQCGWHRKYEKF